MSPAIEILLKYRDDEIDLSRLVVGLQRLVEDGDLGAPQILDLALLFDSTYPLGEAKAALEEAFEGVDFDDLQRRFWKYVRGLR